MKQKELEGEKEVHKRINANVMLSLKPKPHNRSLYFMGFAEVRYTCIYRPS